MKNKFKVMFLFSSICLSSCATLSPEECNTARWDKVGEQDGALGKSNQIAGHYKACSKVNIVPNQSLYESGYQKGLKSYCKPVNIYDEALKGSGYYSVCPMSMHATLRPFYTVAHEYYEAKRKRDLFYIELDRYQNYLLNDKLKPEQRDTYIKKIKELKINQSRIDRDFDYADRDRSRFERENRL